MKRGTLLSFVLALVLVTFSLPLASPLPVLGACDWSGTWDTNFGTMELVQSGSQVTGTYTHDGGRILGTVSGDTLTGTWSEAPSYSPPSDAGDFEFLISSDCGSFTAKWRYGNTGDWRADWTGTKVSAPTSNPPPTPAPGGGPTLTFESRSKATGSFVQIPLTLSGAQELIGNMDITLSYNTLVLQATEVIKGSLIGNALFDYNIQSGTIKISLAHSQGFSGDGSVAYVKYNVIGAEGSTSPLDIVDLKANRASDTASMNIAAIDGIFTVLGVGDKEALGDCNGDGKLTALDALCALQMAVGKKTKDLVMDVNADEQVTSLDARVILRAALGLEQIGPAKSPIGPAKSPTESLLSGTPDRETAASLLSKLESTGVNIQGIELYVFPRKDRDVSYMFAIHDASKGFNFMNMGGGVSSIDGYLIRLASLDESGEYGIERVVMQVLGENGEPLMILTAPTDVINGFAQGTVSREQFFKELEGAVNSGEVAKMAQGAMK
ncbi:cohesin domain-containing protein [Chloroflexota bacterium]